MKALKSEVVRPPPCQLDSTVQELVKLIFDKNMLDTQMIEIGYDASKVPLGKLSNKTIMEGVSYIYITNRVTLF